MEKPLLKPHQFAVGHALYATGHVLKQDKESIFLGEGKVYLTFESKPEALDYMKCTVLEMPSIECWMVDSVGKHVVTIDPNGERH